MEISYPFILKECLFQEWAIFNSSLPTLKFLPVCVNSVAKQQHLSVPQILSGSFSFVSTSANKCICFSVPSFLFLTFMARFVYFYGVVQRKDGLLRRDKIQNTTAVLFSIT
jgi:hypothetical protein